MLALALFIGGLGLGLAVPILVNVVLAGVPGKDAGTAGRGSCLLGSLTGSCLSDLCSFAWSRQVVACTISGG